jgi:tRNA pseudouridine55 synthase
MDGVLVVDKPEGPTSHDVVARARRVLRTRQVGHTGTLDPMATGVLVLVIGRATRLSRFLTCQQKGYDATVRLGLSTDTWDRTGTPVDDPRGPLPDAGTVAEALKAFLGVHPQFPPPYSAKKVEGVRAHVLARAGAAVPVEASQVDLRSCEVLSVAPPLLRLRLISSAGFYVRSLAHDLGQTLGCGGCLEELRRTTSGDFRLEHAADLNWLEAHPDEVTDCVRSMEDLLPAFPPLVLDDTMARRAAHGNDIEIPAGHPALSTAEHVRMLAPDGSLLAIATRSGRGVLHPVVVLK